MKIQVDDEVRFSPIQLTIESREELQAILEGLRMLRTGATPICRRAEALWNQLIHWKEILL